MAGGLVWVGRLANFFDRLVKVGVVTTFGSTPCQRMKKITAAAAKSTVKRPRRMSRV